MERRGNAPMIDLLYDPPLYRPPSEAENLIIQATLGCSFNRCSFCAMYRHKRYLERPLESVFHDIDVAARRWPGARRVFLADGDALGQPTDRLLAILERLAAALPRLARVSCYATPGNLLRKEPGELRALHERKLRLLYVGIESGADRILKKITKGATQRGIAEALTKAEECGLKVSGTVILGLGGTHRWKEHIDGTLELLNRAPLSHLSTLQLYLDESVVEAFHRKYGEPFVIPEDAAILDEQERLIAGLAPPKAVIFRSNHASNALSLAGTLPRDRGRLLGQLREAMSGRRPLRPRHLRTL